MKRTAPASDHRSMFPSSRVVDPENGSRAAIPSRREPAACRPAARDAIWYRRRQPACSVTGFPATVNGTAALANSRLEVVVVVARDVKAEDSSRVR